MANVFKNIRRALEVQLDSISPKPDIAWPNNEYIPTNGTEYIRPTLLPAGSTLETYGGKDRHVGIYQVDIFVPIGNGAKDALDTADTIRELFKSQILTASTLKLYIQAISLAAPESVGDWYICSVEINYLTIEG